eukprot:gene5077-biopygen1110
MDTARRMANEAEREFKPGRGTGFWHRINSAGGRRGGLPPSLRVQRELFLDKLRKRPADLGKHPEWSRVKTAIEKLWQQWVSRRQRRAAAAAAAAVAAVAATM